MTIPRYTIRTPVYKYAKSYHHIDILDGKYTGLQFNFSKIEIIGEEENKEIKFEYNLLHIPEGVEVGNEVQELVTQILLEIIQRGQYELNTE